MYKNIPVVIVAAMSSEQRVIGKNNQLLWHIPADLKRFKQLTLAHPVIMGRKTFESILAILGKPLPGRPNIVLTRDNGYTHEGVETAQTLEEAFDLAAAHNPTEIHIGGGTQIYELALPYVDQLHLTLVHDEPEGDAFFPDFSADFSETHRSAKLQHDELMYEWVDFERKD